jgi:DNA-binding CsgD family transcriptional regulator
MNDKLIRRMIGLGYTNQEIIDRLRCTQEVVNAIRELIRLEEIKRHVKYEDWDE